MPNRAKRKNTEEPLRTDSNVKLSIIKFLFYLPASCSSYAWEDVKRPRNRRPNFKTTREPWWVTSGALTTNLLTPVLGQQNPSLLLDTMSSRTKNYLGLMGNSDFYGAYLYDAEYDCLDMSFSPE